MKKHTLFLLLIFFLLLSLVLVVIFISQRTSFFGRAYGPGIRPSGQVLIENSYLFASPLVALANGQEKIRVTVFILDEQGRGVAGEKVFLGQDERLKITSVQEVTDNLGRAIFDVSANTPGDYLIEARVGKEVLPQRIKLGFN